ncbi:MAG: hypothetical protein Sylvanvirus19_5 [Sylvanvirus sp.]|uniref:Uncharacterized protein n=1 Tax=Sylvanvirus sp. TaxID=2487774 RepID=A0A3G5AII6_9VIRU|nr:MAG: hypothetical protein Sylvanvirus19_5 [Sylvanvirus sp.]
MSEFRPYDDHLGDLEQDPYAQEPSYENEPEDDDYEDISEGMNRMNNSYNSSPSSLHHSSSPLPFSPPYVTHNGQGTQPAINGSGSMLNKSSVYNINPLEKPYYKSPSNEGTSRSSPGQVQASTHPLKSVPLTASWCEKLIVTIGEVAQYSMPPTHPLVRELKDLQDKLKSVQRQMSCFSLEEQNMLIESGFMNKLYVEVKDQLNRDIKLMVGLYKERNNFLRSIQSLSKDNIDKLTVNQKRVYDCIRTMHQVAQGGLSSKSNNENKNNVTPTPTIPIDLLGLSSMTQQPAIGKVNSSITSNIVIDSTNSNNSNNSALSGHFNNPMSSMNMATSTAPTTNTGNIGTPDLL